MLSEVAAGFWEVTLRHSLTLPTPWRAGSPGRGRHPFEADEAAHVVDEVRHSDFASRADDADGAHELGSHAVLLITKYMLDTGAQLRAGRVGGLLRLTEFAIAIGPAMNTALQAAFGELFLDLSAAIGAVGPHVRSRVARIKNIFELLTVVYARVAHHVTAHEFVPAIDADMVLVPEIRAFMLPRPARVLVLLAVLGGLGFPVFRRFAFLDRLVLLARIVLLGLTIVASMICPPMAG